MRYFALFAIQMRAAALTLLQYRLDFFIEAAMGLFWSAAAVVPLLVLFSHRSTVAGWTWPQALMVLACFQLLRGIIDGAVQPSLRAAVEHVRKGTLDFLLIKPADAQFTVSTSRFELWRGTDSVGGLVLLGWAIHASGQWPSLTGALTAAVVLIGAVIILYSTWLLVACLAFLMVKTDDLSYLFSAIYDLARWPSSVFRGAFAVVFTFVIPLAILTTFPALALLGRLSPLRALHALVAALAYALVARLVWLRALARYTGAGG